MTLANDRFREQLMGYLYGELEGDSLREFEESLHASEQHRSELLAMQETLRLSREGFDALRERDQAPPARVSRAVLAAAADREQKSSSFWSFLRTPWLLPTLGVAAAVSVVVLHKEVESPKMPEYQVPTVLPAAPAEPEPPSDLSRFGAAPSQAEPVEAPSGAAGTGGPLAEGVGAGLSDALEQKRDQGSARAHNSSLPPPGPRTSRADEARPVARKAAADDSRPAKGYAVPPPAWSGRAHEESAKKELGEARRPSSSGAAAQSAEEYEAAPARDMGSDGFAAAAEVRGGSGAVAKKPASRARSTANQAAPAAAPSAPAASASAANVPFDDGALGAGPTSSSAGTRAEPPRAPDDAVKKALEHMNARRFGQAAVAYRELLQRYPKDSRVSFFRSQLTAALAALSNVDAIR